MHAIKNIIFDLGGVFLDVDYFKTQDAFIALGVTHFNRLYTQQHASPLFELLETGKITPDEFFGQFRQVSGVALSDDQIRGAWNAMLGEFYTDALQWLEGIARRFNIFLFSNTNKIHEDAFKVILKEQTGYDSLGSFFIKDYYSHTLGLRKPYVESYRAILEEQQLNPAETMFIDDSLKNVEGAIAAGLHGLYLELPRRVTSIQL
ncbi:MAG TPA: HAD family phosphatase [Chitinophagaceae bacterium]|nr:HAD family phosphatase [Chitinophagaceae bacterium]